MRVSHNHLRLRFIETGFQLMVYDLARVEEERDQSGVGIYIRWFEQRRENGKGTTRTEIALVDDVADFDPVESRRLLEVRGEIGCVEAEEREMCLGAWMLRSTTEFFDDGADVEVEEAVEIVFRRKLEIRWRLERGDGPAVEGGCGVFLEPGAGVLVEQCPVPSVSTFGLLPHAEVGLRVRAIESRETCTERGKHPRISKPRR